MRHEQMDQIIESSFDEIRRLRATKGRDYAGTEDQLANFKRNAQGLGLTAEQVWGVYAGKHWDAIQTYCREGDVASEPIEGRIDDLLTYLLLLKGLVVEAREREAHPLMATSVDWNTSRVIPIRRVEPEEPGDAS